MTPSLREAKPALASVLAAPWLATYATLLFLRPAKANRTFESFSQALGLLPGTLGDWTRYGFYMHALKAVGRGVRISFGVEFSDRDTSMGDRVYIGARALLGRCALGSDVLVSSRVIILSGMEQHRFEVPGLTIWQQPGAKKLVTIGNDCWLGGGAIIGADVGHRCVIGAGAVVVKPIPDGSVATGNPARVVGTRP